MTLAAWFGEHAINGAAEPLASEVIAQIEAAHEPSERDAGATDRVPAAADPNEANAIVVVVCPVSIEAAILTQLFSM